MWKPVSEKCNYILLLDKIYINFASFLTESNVFFHFSIRAATVASTIAIQESAKERSNAARKLDYGVNVKGSKETFFVYFFKRSRLL